MISYELIRSHRRSLSMEVTPDRHLLIRAPMHMSINKIEEFVNSHGDWIEKHLALPPMRTYRSLTKAEKAELLARITERVRVYAERMGVTPTGLRISTARKRWGSCSGKNRLAFSEMLADMPNEAVDAIVVHELAHIRQKNHSAAFYREVLSVMPNYRQAVRILKEKNLLPEEEG